MISQYDELLLKAQRDIVLTNSVIASILAVQINIRSVSDSVAELTEKAGKNCEQINDFLELD